VDIFPFSDVVVNRHICRREKRVSLVTSFVPLSNLSGVC
jgi:hypothetical protein